MDIFFEPVPVDSAESKPAEDDPRVARPPEHRAYRQLLRPYFESKAIAPLEPRIIEWTETIIDAVAGKGECEFFEAVASRLPVSVFMEMFGFPLDRFEYFRSLVTGYFNAQTAPMSGCGCRRDYRRDCRIDHGAHR